MKKWDAFISHASEDKDSFVRPLAESLKQLGAEVWFDEFTLRVGDSLSRSIDRGLADSKFGIVVISPDFLKKPWPEYELRGLVSREIEEGRVILPVWLNVTRKEVLKFSPPLADKLALRTSGIDAQDIAIQLLREIRPDLYDQHPRAELERLASGKALDELQEQLERTREELSEYRCPTCGAPVAERGVAVHDQYDELYESFECGYATLDGDIKRPCPSDPKFPKFEEYKLEFYENPKEPHWPWRCFAFGETDMARRLSLQGAVGRTKEEAEQKLREEYTRVAKKHAG